MTPLLAQIQMQYADAPDLACAGNASAEDAALWAALAAATCVPLAAWYRRRAAEQEMQTTWAAIALLAGASQVIGLLFLVATGCLSGRALVTFVGSASPWLLVAGLFRGAVAPLPERLRPDIPRGSRTGER